MNPCRVELRTFLGQSEVPEKWRAATLSKIELPPKDKVHSYSKHENIFNADPV